MTSLTSAKKYILDKSHLILYAIWFTAPSERSADGHPDARQCRSNSIFTVPGTKATQGLADKLKNLSEWLGSSRPFPKQIITSFAGIRSRTPRLARRFLYRAIGKAPGVIHALSVLQGLRPLRPLPNGSEDAGGRRIAMEGRRTFRKEDLLASFRTRP
jgi:hypothetical protein